MKKWGFVEVLAWIVMAAAFGAAAYGMKILPEQIAVHYDINGQIDKYGSPAALSYFLQLCFYVLHL